MKSFIFIQILFFFSFNLYAVSRVKKPKQDNNISYINIEPSVFFSSIKVYDTFNNANGNIVSDYNYGLKLSFNDAISSSLQYKIILDFKTYNFKENIEHRTYNENKFNTYEAGLGLKKIFSSDLIVDLDFVLAEEFYIRFLNEASILTDKAYAYNLSLNIYYEFFNYEKLKLASEINPILIYPNKIKSLYKADLSYGVKIGFSLRYRIIKFLAAYKTLYKNTEILNQQQRDLIFMGRLSWAL